MSFPKDLGMVPEKLFLDKSKTCNPIRLQNDSGIDPWNLLPDNERYVKSIRSPMLFEISPDNWFWEKSILVTTFHFPISIGRVPLREFEDKFSSKISISLVKVEGIELENLLESKYRCLRETRSPKHSGIGPANLLPVKYKKPKLFKLHNSVGKDPSNLLPWRESLCKFLNLQILEERDSL